MAADETIAVLGAGGTMGQAMARNLLEAGYTVRAWNRSREKAEPLAQDGAEVCDTPAGAADGATMVLTMLSNGDAVLDAMADVTASATSPSPVWLQMSTVGENETDRCANLADEHGFAFVDTPVSGTKEPAEQGTLVILASGPEALRDRLEPIFDVVGQKTMWAGEAGAGTRLKIAVNSWLLSVVEGAAETLALAEGLGLDPQLVLDSVKDGPLDSDYLQMKGASMIERSFEPSFALKLAVKDAGLMVESARQHELDLPLITTIEQRLKAGLPDHADADLSVTFLTSAPAPTAS